MKSRPFRSNFRRRKPFNSTARSRCSGKGAAQEPMRRTWLVFGLLDLLTQLAQFLAERL